jgi:methionine biosynthesis protein MetW
MGGEPVTTRLDRITAAPALPRLAPEHRLIVELIEPGSRVLDLGCGEGDLLKALQVEKNARAEGIELADTCIEACVAKGLFNVHHGDLDEGLADYPDQAVDYVILTNTIQVLHHPLFLIQEMARVGRRCIITFPNFGHWYVRGQLFFLGHLPKSRRLPYEWYDTPNIRLLTIADFHDLCRKLNLRVVHQVALVTRAGGRCRRISFWPNLRADAAVFVIEAAH